MIDLGTATFAHATRLTASEAAALTLVPWAARYPPIGRALSRSSPESAIREPWRQAFALLHDAYPQGAPLDRLPLFEQVDPRAMDLVRQMLDGDPNFIFDHETALWSLKQNDRIRVPLDQSAT